MKGPFVAHKPNSLPRLSCVSPCETLPAVWCSARQAPLPVLISLPSMKQARWHIIRKAKIAPAQLSTHPHPNDHHATSQDRLLCVEDGDNAGKIERKELFFTAGWGSWLSQVQDETFPHLFHDHDPKAMLLLQWEDFIGLFFPLLTPLIPAATFPCAISPCSVKKSIWASRAQAKEAFPSHFKLAALCGILCDAPSSVVPQIHRITIRIK